MRKFSWLLLLFVVITWQAGPAVADEEISGNFEIKENGQIIGAEKFTILFENDGRISAESRGTTRQDDNEAKDYTKLLMRNLSGPVHSYQREVFVSKLPRVLGATYENGELIIELRDGPRKREQRMSITPATMILDVGVWSHLHILLHRYSHRTGGEQRFVVAIPSGLRLVDPLTLRLIGHEAVSLQNGFFMANKYFLNRGDVGMIIWADKEGRILKIESPMQALSVELIKYDGERAPEINPVKVIGGDLVLEQVRIPTQEGTLAGVLTKPRGIEGRLPGIVFLSTSGPHDRDGNSPTVAINIGTGEWLDSISGSGFAVLRLDDRGVGESEGDLAKSSLSVQALDAVTAIDFLRARPDIDSERIALIGHGEGANVAIVVAAKRSDLKAMVVVSPSDVPLSQLVEEQTRARIEAEGASNPMAFERHPLINMMRLAKEKPDQKFTVLGGKPVYLDVYREWFAMQPVADLQNATAKVLHVQPGMDLQVFPRHAAGFRDALGSDGRYSYKEFSKLNHFLKPSRGTIGEYADPEAKVDEDFVQYLIGWLKANL